MKNLLLLSTSTTYGTGYLDHAMDAIREHFSSLSRIAFVPFAFRDHEGYTRSVRDRFAREGIDVFGISPDGVGADLLEGAEGVFVGGGNTFRLLYTLRRSGLLEVLQTRARAGMPYLGSSAGSNVVCPTIRTTNDMPIVEVETLRALALVPFQINPHYQDPVPNSHHMGETREQRLLQYLEENETPVVGLREGSWLSVQGDLVRLEGALSARVFRRGIPPVEAPPGEILPYLFPDRSARVST